MAITTITIGGKVLRPDGTGVSGGTITVKLLGAGSADDGGTEQVVGGEFTTAIAADGTVAFSLAPNTGNLAGTRYAATFRFPDGSRLAREWTVAASPATQDIGDLS